MMLGVCAVDAPRPERPGSDPLSRTFPPAALCPFPASGKGLFALWAVACGVLARGRSARTLLLTAACLLAASGTSLFAQVTQPTEGERLIAEARWQEAEKWYYAKVKAEPKNSDALRQLGFVELRRPGGDAVRAVQYLERALAIEPDHPQGLFMLGKAYQADDRDDQARKSFDRLIEIGPGKREPMRAIAVHLAKFNRGLMAIEEGDVELARTLFAQVARREPKHAYVPYEFAFVAKKNGENEKAIALFKETLENLLQWVSPETWPYPQGRYAYLRENASYELARLQLETGKPEEVITGLERLVEDVRIRSKAKTRSSAPPPRSPLQGETDARFENAPYIMAEALAAVGRKKEASALFKEFSRMRIGDRELRSKARSRAKEVKK